MIRKTNQHVCSLNSPQHWTCMLFDNAEINVKAMRNLWPLMKIRPNFGLPSLERRPAPLPEPPLFSICFVLLVFFPSGII